MGRAAVESYSAQRPVHSNICNPIRMESKMTLIMNNKMPQAGGPLTYNDTCRRYAARCEQECVIGIGVPQPNRGLSEIMGNRLGRSPVA